MYFTAFKLCFINAVVGCCIFHKQKAFGESDSDESNSDIDEAQRAEGKDGESLGVKPYQRFHA